jgi:hypothetical protein
MQPINRFILLGDTVHEPLDLASAIPGQAVRTYRIGLPKTWDSLAMRHSYAWVYALQNEKSPVPDHSLVLFEEKLIRGQWMRKTWVDRNGDLVFDAFEMADTSWQINSDWMLELGPNLSLMMQPFPVQQFFAFAQMHDQSVKALVGPRHYMGAAFAFRYQRQNLRYGYHSLDSNRGIWVAAVDQNFNGKYNDPGVDRIILSMDSVRFYDEFSQNWPEKASNMNCVWRGQAFSLQWQGEQLMASRIINGEHPLLNGNRLPRIRFHVADTGLGSWMSLGKHRSWRAYRGFQIIMWAWHPDMGFSTTDSQFLADLSVQQRAQFQALYHDYKLEHSGDEPSRRIQKRWFLDTQSLLNVRMVMMAQGGDERSIKTLNRRYSWRLDQLVLDNRAARTMQWQSLPQLLWVDRCGRIVDADFNLLNFKELNNF